MSDLGHPQNPASNSDISLCPHLNEIKTFNEAIYRWGMGQLCSCSLSSYCVLGAASATTLQGGGAGVVEVPADTPGTLQPCRSTGRLMCPAVSAPGVTLSQHGRGRWASAITVPEFLSLRGTKKGGWEKGEEDSPRGRIF